jgi:hypothetical protein
MALSYKKDCSLLHKFPQLTPKKFLKDQKLLKAIQGYMYIRSIFVFFSLSGASLFHSHTFCKITNSITFERISKGSQCTAWNDTQEKKLIFCTQSRTPKYNMIYIKFHLNVIKMCFYGSWNWQSHETIIEKRTRDEIFKKIL